MRPSESSENVAPSHLYQPLCGCVALQASCIDSTAPAEQVFAREVAKLQEENFKPLEQLTLEPYERDHAVVVGQYRPIKKSKK